MDALTLQNRLKQFAYRVIKLTKALPTDYSYEVITRQIVRSAFSAAANYIAACRAQTTKSFIAKLSIAVEEIDESNFWLEVIGDMEFIKKSQLSDLLNESLELTKILSASRKTAQAKIKKSLINQ